MMLWAWRDAISKKKSGDASRNPSYVARRVNVLFEDWVRHGLIAQPGSQDKIERSVRLVKEVLHIIVDESMRQNPCRGGWAMTGVQAQTDPLSLVQDVNTSDLDLAANGVLFKEIIFLARLNFNQVVFSFCPRKCNKVADALAPVMWPDQAP